MSPKIETTWAFQVPPNEETEDLHEFALVWYRFSGDSTEVDPVLKRPALPVVWIRFGKVEELEQIQRHFPEAKLGPSSRFSEGLLIAQSWEEAQELEKRVRAMFRPDEASKALGEVIEEDTMEDY